MGRKFSNRRIKKNWSQSKIQEEQVGGKEGGLKKEQEEMKEQG